MTTQRVDTNRPEYSWIPFYRELAEKLLTPEVRGDYGTGLVEIVKEMVDAGLPVPGGIAKHNQERLDPFTFMTMLNYLEIGNDTFQGLANHIRERLRLDSKVPHPSFLRPSFASISGARYFEDSTDATEDIGAHWKLFESALNWQMTNVGVDDDFLDLFEESLSVKHNGLSKLTGALYWIAPHEFLHVQTIDGILKSIALDPIDRNATREARSYFECLATTREVDRRPGPILNDLVYRGEWKAPDRKVWLVRSREGEYTAAVVANGYIGLGWDEVDLKSCTNRQDVKQALAQGRSELTERDQRGIAQSAGSVARYLFGMKPGDIVMTPVSRGPVHLGMIRSVPTYDNDDGLPFATRRAVDWNQDGPFERDFLPSTVWNRQQTVIELQGVQAVTALGYYDAIVQGKSSSTDDELRVWTVKANGGSNAEALMVHGYSAVGWDFPGLEDCGDIEDVKGMFPKDDPDYSPRRVGNEAGSLNRFLNHMKIGDYVITATDDGRFFYGVVTGDVTYHNDDGKPYPTRRAVKWQKSDPKRKDDLPKKVWDPQQTVLELKYTNRDAFLQLIGQWQPPQVYNIDTMLAEGVFMERDELARILSLLQRKRNLILQGPPGTGKTFLAKRLAYALMAERADERVAGVQFHQSYSYEDFVGGYRPGVNNQEQLVFSAQDGAFLRLCDRARESYSEWARLDPDEKKHQSPRKFVMLIDEINRGNLSRVFGELLMLIEADKRSPEHAVELQHRRVDDVAGDDDDAKFYVPDNVYIIGTMNLADRSLTGMNVAMRRRFGFAELKPQFESPQFVDWIDGKTAMPSEMRERIQGRMKALNDAIESDASLGRQYAVGHSFFCPDPKMELDEPGWEAWYRDVVEYEIRPLLEEYWFDDADTAKEQFEKLKL